MLQLLKAALVQAEKPCWRNAAPSPTPTLEEGSGPSNAGGELCWPQVSLCTLHRSDLGAV